MFFFKVVKDCSYFIWICFCNKFHPSGFKVANAFKVKATVTAKHIAIIDDVMTTGHTLNALANQLKKQGAQQVDVWCCARTQLFLKI